MKTTMSKKYFSMVIILALLCSGIYLELLTADSIFVHHNPDVLRSTITTSDGTLSSQTICSEELLGRQLLSQSLRKGRRMTESPRLRLELSLTVPLIQQGYCQFLLVLSFFLYQSAVVSTVIIIQYIQQMDGKKSPNSNFCYC